MTNKKITENVNTKTTNKIKEDLLLELYLEKYITTTQFHKTLQRIRNNKL